MLNFVSIVSLKKFEIKIVNGQVSAGTYIDAFRETQQLQILGKRRPSIKTTLSI